MIVRKFADSINFFAEHNEFYKVVHTLTHSDGCSLSRNEPFEWLNTSLSAKNPNDLEHPSFYISHSTDESPASVINGGIIGGNHGHPCTINVISYEHGKTLADVGSTYVDDEGTVFTILRVVNEDTLNLVSENIGESENNYNFKLSVVGNLKYRSDGENVSDINVCEQQSKVFLLRATLFTKRNIVAIKDGKRKITLGTEDCDDGELIENYLIINPATVAPALTAERPKGGYKHTPDLARCGKPMLSVEQTSHFYADGSITIEFNVKKLADVNFSRYLGVMYQEKLDVFGGGIHRCLPKLKPFTTPEGTFDFSSPYPLRGEAFPESYSPKLTECKDPNSPFDRIVDYFRDKDGKDRLGFACGFLPVYDGRPEIRKNLLNSVIHIYKTRKAYPNFATGDLDSFKGVAYRKYFDPEQRASVYSIPFENKKYIYFDIFENASLSFKTSGEISLFEKDGDLTYKIENGIITVSGNKGFAVFIEE